MIDAMIGIFATLVVLTGFVGFVCGVACIIAGTVGIVSLIRRFVRSKK